MLIVENILNKMKTHFPRWMDIRRKVNTSSGGLLLSSLAEEVADIQHAIDEYKKDFFLDKYINHEDDIITFIYKANIGSTDSKSITLINPDIKITLEQKDFFETDNLCYYSDGVLYFRTNFKEIEYAIDGYKSKINLEKIHVWNIFDEFATFVGLRRYQWETNKELLNRLLSKSNKTINSSELGLKNALISNLINLAPELKLEDISIERPTAENLKQYYTEFETVLDHLADVNRDVYRTKKWDVDTWNFSIKSVDYIAHAWDIALKSYVDGVGFKDDLEVKIIDNDAKTDATIYFYKKQIEVVNSYIKNNNIKENIKLYLKKYDNDLKADKIKYRLTASESKKLDVLNTTFNFYEEKTGNKTINIQDISHDESENTMLGVSVNDKSLLDNDFKYKLKFIPINPLNEFRIDELKQVSLNGTETNLITEKPGFRFTSDAKQGVVCTATTKYILDKYQYSNITNAHKTIDGFSITDLSEQAIFKLNLNGCAYQKMYYSLDAKEVPVLYNNIIKKNCFISNDYIIPDTVDEETSISIYMKMNSMSMTIEGPYTITYSINKNGKNVKSDYSNKKFEFKIEKESMPQDIEVTVVLHDKACRISNITYSKFDLIMYTDNDIFNHSESGAILPGSNYNNLFIKLFSYTGFSPILKYIYIGEELNDTHAYGDIDFIPYEKVNKLKTSYNNCRLELTKINKSTNDIVEVIEDYIPYKEYSAKSNDSQMELILDDYLKIEYIKAEGCEIETINYGNDYIQYLLKIPTGVSISSIVVSGSIKKLIKTNKLSEILQTKGYSAIENDFYVAKNIDEIVVLNKINSSLRYINLERRDLFDVYNISSVEIIPNKNNNIIAKFIERDTENNNLKKVVISNTFNEYFDYFTFVPTDSNIYVAMNEYDVIFPETNNIKIVNTFTQGYDINKKMFYTIESLNDKYIVNFSNSSSMVLDEDEISIIRKDNKEMNYNYETIIIEREFPLGSTIELPRMFILDNKDQIDLDRYIITNELDISYSDKNSDPDNELDYYCSETLYIDKTGFNKLKYSNVKEVVSIEMKKELSTVPLTLDNDYTLLSTEGIIVWNDKSLIDEYEVVTIKYHIKKAKLINISEDDLYKKVKYNINSYNLISNVKLEKIDRYAKIDLNIYSSYKVADLTSINCSEPGFAAIVSKEGILSFEKNIEKNTVAVRTGYYYMDGNEYFLYADENFDNIEKIDDIYFNNVIKENKKFILKQQTTNFILNSSMKLNLLGNVFNLDCHNKDITGVSDLACITACESFNYWNIIASNLSISKGMNGQGINITSMRDINGYAYIPFFKFLKKKDDYILSFHLEGKDCKAYLGKERLIRSVNSEFNKESVIDIVKEIKHSEIEDNIFETEFYNDMKERYFLIIEGTGLIDDIIVIEKSKFEVGMHKKNIDHLRINVEENIYAEFNTRIFLTEKDGSIFDGTEIKDNTIINSSYIHWGFTSITNINTYEEFKKCNLKNINLEQYNNKCIAKTSSTTGKLITSPIYVGNVKTIKNLLFKINNVMFDNMKGFKVKILTADSVNANFKEISNHLDNIGSVNGDILSSYIKLMVEMPSDKVINNIEVFIEYLSNDINTPSEMSVISGVYTTKVLDAQYSERFLIKNLNIGAINSSLKNYTLQIRASKENDEKTTWTSWKTITLKANYTDTEHPDIKKNGNILNRIVFDDYRYFQFRLSMKGEDVSIKLNYIDLEVI